MRPLRLRHLLLGVIAVTIVAATWLGWVRAMSVLRENSDAQAQARVEAAALLARTSIERAGSELVATTRILAERPTLQRYVEAGDQAALTDFLDRFAATGDLFACAVVRDGELWAPGGAFVGGELVRRTLSGPPATWRLLVGGESLLLAARVALVGADGLEVLVFDALPRFAGLERDGEDSQQLRAEVIDRARALDAFGDPRSVVWGRALDDTTTHVERLREPASFVAATALLDGAGELTGVVSTALDFAVVDAPRQELGRRLLRDILILGVVGGLALWWIGRRIAGSLETLTASAARIGEGDLDSPVPRAATTAEILALGRAMEEMRQRIHDLTAQLRRERTESEGVLRGMADGVFAVDRERRIQYLSPQAATMLGTTPEAARGRFCGDVLRPTETQGRRPCEERCPILEARSQGSARRTELLQVNEGGVRTVIITSTADPLDETAAHGARQVQVMRDETDVEAARRLRDNVVANVSHEFRTPLSAQLASLEMLVERIPAEHRAELEPLLHSIERGSLRLTRLVDNLLESLSIDAGRATLRRRDVDIADVCREALDATLPLIAQKQQRIHTEFVESLAGVEGDRVRLVQVLVNLIANANKFAPHGASIALRARTVGSEVEICVEDDGPGLPDGADERLFDRFVRASGEQPGESGLGLGLWLVRSIVERHGGRVVAMRLDPGTRFVVTLPRKETP